MGKHGWIWALLGAALLCWLAAMQARPRAAVPEGAAGERTRSAPDPALLATHIVRRSPPADRRALIDRLAPALPDGVLRAIHESADL